MDFWINAAHEQKCFTSQFQISPFRRNWAWACSQTCGKHILACKPQHSLKPHLSLAWLSSPTSGLPKSTNNELIRGASNRSWHQSLKRTKSGVSYRWVWVHTYPLAQHNHIRGLLKTTHKSHFQMTWHIQKNIFCSDGTIFLSASGPSKWWCFSAIRSSAFGFRRIWIWREWRVSSFVSCGFKEPISNFDGAYTKELLTDVVWFLLLC